MNSHFSITENELVVSNSSFTSSNFSNLPLKQDPVFPRNINSTDYLSKEQFIHHNMSNDVPLNLQASGSRYRHTRLANSHTVSLEDPNINPFCLKNLHPEIRDLSFPEELPPLVRPVPNVPVVNQYYYKPVESSVDVYHSDFSDEFSNDNFCDSLPSTSAIFSQNDTASPYILPESQPDELLLNGIDLSDHERLILSSEDLAMLTQGKQGCCLELILNNGEVIYTVVDSENDYNPSSPRLSQVSREILSSVRPYETNVNDSLVNHVSGHSFETGIASTPNFDSRTSPIATFHNNSPHYSSVISSSLGKTITSSSVSGENFNICCDFTSEDNDNFQAVIDPYQPVLSEKSSSVYGSLIRNDQTSLKETKKTSVSQPSSKLERVSSKTDYFPSAVNSIVVSETGKKYPKKYSFYSNISSFMNQESLDKGNDEKTVKTDAVVSVCQNTSFNSIASTSAVETVAQSCSNVDIVNPGIGILNPPDLNETLRFREVLQNKLSDKSLLNNVSHIQETVLLDDNIDLEATCEKSIQIIPINLHSTTKSPHNPDETLKNKFLNSPSEIAINSICDRAIQTRARATLPDSYLSINRIKFPARNKNNVYGVFALKTIPLRTQFGPFEGVLIKDEVDEEATCNGNCLTLQLTVEMETGKFYKLDVSNEDTCNWMKFVRSAATCKEQNLVVDQQGTSLYFTTTEVIHPKQELLVWYSREYSRARNYMLLSGDSCSDIPYEITSTESLETAQLKIVSSAAENKKTESTCESSSDIELTDCSNVSEHSSSQPSSSFAIDTKPKETINSVLKKSKPAANSASSNGKKSEKSKKSLWLCTYCDLTFSNASVMNFHILVHAADNDEGMNTAESVDIESYCQRPTDDEESYECPQCCVKFNRKKELIIHVSKHGLKVQRWTDKPTNSSADPAENSKTEQFDTKNYSCSSCNKSFKTALALDIHTRFHSATLECPMCEMTFKKLTDMREHVHTHAVNGIFTCPHCPKTYDRYKYMRKHIRACHGKNTFCCKLCKKTCKSRYKLKSHMLRHSDEKEFLCSICGKQFKRMDKLSEHVKNTHSEEREKSKMEIINQEVKLKKSLKKKVPSKVLRLITENVNNFFYKCYLCNIGFKRRGMLVNHLNLFHPTVSLDTVPELNVPIQKAYCNFYCLYCDKVYKSNSKRKEHILKSHPGAKIPSNLERGSVLNDPFAKHVGNVVSDPFNCEFCHRQYASRAKLLNHHRKNHADLLPADLKSPRNWNSRRKKRKEAKSSRASDGLPANAGHSNARSTIDNLQLRDMEFAANSTTATTASEVSILPPSIPPIHSIAATTKEAAADAHQDVMNLTHLLADDVRNATATQEQYVKILQSSNGLALAQTDENSTALLQQIFTSYSFSNA